MPPIIKLLRSLNYPIYNIENVFVCYHGRRYATFAMIRRSKATSLWLNSLKLPSKEQFPPFEHSDKTVKCFPTFPCFLSECQ